MENVDYTDTFITTAPDFVGDRATAPTKRAGKPTVASATYAMVIDDPYRYRASDVIFRVWADRQDLPESDRAEAWNRFYAKGRACLRASDLPKRYGWGVHSDADGRIALYPVESPEYARLRDGIAPDGTAVTVRPAMRSRRA